MSHFFALAISALMLLMTGCNFVPDIRKKPQYHNPFPQLSRVAVLPFRNQSQDPTLSGARVSMAYYNELQSIPGFEVVPYGAVENQLAYYESYVVKRTLATAEDFQLFAKHLGVDAVLQGSITDYDSYYPPRMTLKVNWYAANPGLHPIPVGYGLPWGTKKEKDIPSWIKLESERTLAREQIATQTPAEPESEPIPLAPAPSPQFQRSSPAPSTEQPPVEPQEQPQRRDVQQNEGSEPPADETLASKRADRIALARIPIPGQTRNEPSRLDRSQQSSNRQQSESKVVLAGAEIEMEEPPRLPAKLSSLQDQVPIHLNADGSFVEAESNEGYRIVEEGIDLPVETDSVTGVTIGMSGAEGQELPADWPDPQGFVPRRPTPQRPVMRAQFEPVMSHMKAYNGNDEDFTHALQEYYYFRDDARFGGWQTYLQRSEDFIRFCCHLHIIETLGSRGGQLESRLNLRWPINRYER